MLEISRALASLKAKGVWKPKRSVMFMSWGGEEHSYVGSVEWIEVNFLFFLFIYHILRILFIYYGLK